MMGFGDNFQFPVTEAQTMKQLGNSVAVNAIQAVGKVLVNELKHEHANNLETCDREEYIAPKVLTVCV